MHSAFGTVLWIVCLVGAIGAVAGLLASRQTWDDLGKNRLLMDSELPRQPGQSAAAASWERDAEIRQMLEARNARRIRRGEEPLDIERQLAELTAGQQASGPGEDPALRQEVRDLVVARNYRRTRAGKPALDVEAEIERELAKLADL